jgi:hypothetical protein
VSSSVHGAVRIRGCARAPARNSPSTGGQCRAASAQTPTHELVEDIGRYTGDQGVDDTKVHPRRWISSAQAALCEEIGNSVGEHE